jgi:putative redox protein
MEVRIQHAGGKQSIAIARGHQVICDLPRDQGGEDGGMTPPELWLAGIGGCAMHYATEYLRARHLPTDEIDIRVSAEKGGAPMRLIDIKIDLEVPVLNGERIRTGLLRAVETCLLHRTLNDPPRVKVTLTELVAH